MLDEKDAQITYLEEELKNAIKRLNAFVNEEGKNPEHSKNFFIKKFQILKI